MNTSRIIVRTSERSRIPKRLFYSSSLKLFSISSPFSESKEVNTVIPVKPLKTFVPPPPEFLKSQDDKKDKKTIAKKKTDNKIIDGSYLTEHFSSSSDFPMPPMTTSVRKNVDMFMLRSVIELDRTVYDYDKIPGETPFSKDDTIHNIEDDEFIDDLREEEQEEEQEQEQELLSDKDKEFLNKYDNQDIYGEDKPMKEAQSRHLAKMDKKLKEEDIFNNLPEILLMGRCNVGKSSLVNALLSTEKSKAKNLYARVKDEPGYTPCLNMYNIGNRLRLVDSPGYGEKGKVWQGELVMEYLERRRVLRRVYLLLDSKVGVTRYDEVIIERLVDLGVSFDVIFTKIDKLPNAKLIASLAEVMEDPILKELKIQPYYYFTNSHTPTKNSPIPLKSGLTEVRRGILEACGYDMTHALHPITRNIPKPPRGKKKKGKKN